MAGGLLSKLKEEARLWHAVGAEARDAFLSYCVSVCVFLFFFFFCCKILVHLMATV